MLVFTLVQLLESGVHFGHQTRRWNPKMSRYICTARNGVHIIDLVQTAQLIQEAYAYMRSASEQGKKVIFVCTKRSAADIVAQEASRCGSSYVNQRWLGGMLANWATTKTRVEQLRELERRKETGALDLLPRKQSAVLQRELKMLQKYLGGIKSMRTLPDVAVIIDPKREYDAVLECQKLGITTISIMDADCDPDLTDISIPANDDSVEAIKLIVGRLADAIYEGKLSAFANEELYEVEEGEFISNDTVDLLDGEDYIELDEISNEVELEENPEQSGNLYVPVTNKIDPYLLHSFEALDEISLSSSIENINEGISKSLLPMMVRVNEASWNPADIPDCELVFQLGEIFAISGTLRTLAFLYQDPKVISVEASRPGMSWDSSISESTTKTLEVSTSEESICSRVCSENISLVQVNDVHEASEKGDASIIAIIDTGIDILHEAFLDGMGEKTRIIAIWDQTDDTGPSPQIPGIPNLGTEHTEEKINEYLKNQLVPPKLGRDPNGHGTHVASIAAGKPGKHFLGGIAPEAKVILVKPRMQSNSGDQYSLGYSHTHGLALIYIRYIAQRESLPVVVNVSQGMNAGAHDGTSLLELCFDNFSGGGRDYGFIIVKSAGNERNQKNHAQFSIAKDSADSLRWNSEPVYRHKDVIELWFKACNLLRFRLKNPSGERSEWVTADENLRDRFSSGNSFSISYIRYHKDNGDSRFLLTISPGMSGLMEDKEWVLEIESVLVENPEEVIHAWIEKDPNRSISFANHLSESVTLSIPGTAKTVISVGSVNTSKPFRIAEYSSYGPTRDGRPQPDVSAPGENISAALSGSSDGICTMSGTSMAAPHVTGSIALLLSARRKKCATQQGLDQFNAAQVRSAICHVTQNFSGQWHSGMGYGVLDAMSLMKTLNCI